MTKRISSARLRRAVANPTTSAHLPVPPKRADAKDAVKSLLASGALEKRAFDGTKAQVVEQLATIVSDPSGPFGFATGFACAAVSRVASGDARGSSGTRSRAFLMPYELTYSSAARAAFCCAS